MTKDNNAPDDALDVWLRFDYTVEDAEAEAEANTFRTEDGYRVEWYLNAVGLVKEEHFPTYKEAQAWLEEQDFQDFTA